MSDTNLSDPIISTELLILHLAPVIYLLERPVDYRKDWKLTTLLDDIHQSDLQTFHAQGIVDKPKLKSICVAGIVHNTPLEPFEIALGNVHHSALPARKVGVNKADQPELHTLGHTRSGMADKPPIQTCYILVPSVQQTEPNTRYGITLRNELNRRNQRKLDRLLLSQYRLDNKNESEEHSHEQTTVFPGQLVLLSIDSQDN